MTGPGEVSIFVGGRRTMTWGELLGAAQRNIGAETVRLEGIPLHLRGEHGHSREDDWREAAYWRAKLKRLTLADTND